ncbi:MAG: DUF3431 domain-containing protein [Desulfovibrio sp.]|nr:DUF3431 domain-containing protein [Desulfovibrio sp.]MBI4960571.1 DUF3431 domain-containing protein [Desulfovibrio sp.]
MPQELLPGADQTVEVVVARYQEDASWVRGMGLPCVVYDKSGQPGPHALPNIGRESHTYLSHIVAQYPDYADFTVFLQADPFKHTGQGADTATLKARIEQNVRLQVKFTGFAHFKLKCDRLGRPHGMADPEKKGLWKGWGKDIPVGEVYGKLFSGDVPETFLVTAPAGQLFVCRERILARPKAFYERALKLVVDDPDDEHNTGHAFERLWQVVFNGNVALNREAYS